MLKPELNDRLTRVGRGTPMGTMMRKYWFPIAASTELGQRPIRRRLLGEDIVIYRLPDGRLGAIESNCPHRRASLKYGIIEDDGLRCGYHGWKFDLDGQCVDQPAEPADSTFSDRVRAVSYRAQELGGLVFLYLGDDPAPELPRYDLFVWDGVMRDIGHATLPMNWLQIMENSMDPHHVEWLHGHYMRFVRGLSGEPQPEVLARKHVKIAFDEFEHGIIKRRILEGMTEDDDDWKIGHPIVFPVYLRVGGGGHYQFQIRVPIDDTHTSHFWYSVYRPEKAVDVPPQDEVPIYEVPWQLPDGEFIDDNVDGQDIMAWATQGPIADRSHEHLGKSDLGVIMLRRVLQQQLEIVEQGGDPIGLIRDPARNVQVDLPQEEKKFGAGGAFRTEFLTMGQCRYSPIADDVLEWFKRTEIAVTGKNEEAGAPA